MFLSLPKTIGLSVLLMFGTLGTQAVQAEETIILPYSDVVSMPKTQNSLDPSVTLYFGNQLYPNVSSRNGTFYFTRRVNRMFKAVDTTCRSAALAAILDLQKRARDIGANAVVNITSYYNQHPLSGEKYQCHVGPLSAEVTLKGSLAIIN